MTDTTYHERSRFNFTLREYLVASTVLSAFGTVPIAVIGESNIWLGYFILVFNSVILLIIGKLVVHRNLFIALMVIAALTLLSAERNHYSLVTVIVQIVGLGIFTVYFYSVFHLRHVSVAKMFELYCKLAAVVAAFGIIKSLFLYATTGVLERVTSLFTETPQFIYATIPAMCYALLKWRDRSWRFYTIVMIVSYVLAQSSLGMIGVISVLAVSVRSARGFLLGVVGIVAIVLVAYTFSDQIKMRVDDTLRTRISTEAAGQIKGRVNRNDPDRDLSVTEANASTLALVSNGYVTYRVFMESPLFGTGLGTHRYSYDIYAPDVIPVTNSLLDLNKYDADSLFLRLISETGLCGVAFVFFLIFFFSRVQGDEYILIRNSVLPCFVIDLIRHGNYFSFTLTFFSFIYFFNYIEYKRRPTTFQV